MDGYRRAQGPLVKRELRYPVKRVDLRVDGEKGGGVDTQGLLFYFPSPFRVTINFSPSFFSFSLRHVSSPSSHVAARAVLWPVLLRYTTVSIAKPLRHAYKYIYLYKYRAPGTRARFSRHGAGVCACMCVCVLAHVVTHKGD